MEFLDWLLHALHLAVIVINTTFWMFKKTLRVAQITLFLTAVSWIGFGFWYGFGYCFLTDWHWQIKETLGETNLPNSYIKYIVDRVFGVDSAPDQVDFGTAIVTAVSVIGCTINSFRFAPTD